MGSSSMGPCIQPLPTPQRELISEYFKQSPTAAQAGADHDGAVTPDPPGDHGSAGSAGGEADPAHGASVVDEQPRVW